MHDDLYSQDNMPRPPNLPLKQKNKNKNNNNTQSTHLNTTNDLEDVIENIDDDSTSWTLVQPTKDGKRCHSSSSEQNSPQTPVNKNKKFFFPQIVTKFYHQMITSQYSQRLIQLIIIIKNLRHPLTLNLRPLYPHQYS